MSSTITISPTISYVNGIITEGSIDSIVSETENALNSIGDKISGQKTLYSSESSMLSPSDIKIPSMSYGILIQQASDIFTVSGKEYVLSLVPSSPSQITFSFPETYQYVSTITSQTIRQYTINGRVVVFSVVPSEDFSVSYSGYMPQDYGAIINGQMLYPNPLMISLGKDDYPTVVKMSSTQNIYNITLSQKTGIESSAVLIQSGLQSYIAPEIQQYISASGLIETPLDIVSLWVYENDTYNKIELEYFKILSSNVFSVKTLESINENAQYIVSLISKSIPDLISEIYVAYKNHTHDDFGNTRRINHKSIIIDENSNSHPEYLRRDGYNNTLKTNAMYGPLFLSSANPSSFGSNVLSPSNAIHFGDFSVGHKMYREESESGSLILDPRDSSGLKILIQTPLSGEDSSKILESIDFSINLRNEPLSTKTSTVLNSGDKLIVESENGLYSNKIVSSGITIPTLGKLLLNGVELTSTQDGAVFSCQTNKNITFSNGLILSNSKIQNSVFENNTVSLGSKINFGSNYILSDVNSIKVKGKISIDDYAELSVVSENNELPISLSNVTTLKSNSKILFIRPIENGLTFNGTQYSFLETISNQTRIDRVSDWPKQDIATGNIEAYSLKLNDSSFSEKNGISFGTTSKIYTSTNDSVCSLDSLVLESKDDVVFLKIGDTTEDCDTKEFLGIRVGSVSSGGTVSAEDFHANGNGTFGSLSVSSVNIDEAGNISTDANLSSKTINVSGESSFGNTTCLDLISSSIKTRGIDATSITSSGSIVVSQDLNVSNGLSAKSGTITETLSAKKVVSESVETGIIKSSDILSSGSIVASGKISATSVESSGDITSSSSIVGAGVYAKTEVITKYIESDSITSSTGVFNKSIRTASLIVDGETIVNGGVRTTGDIITSGSITADGSVKIYSGLTVRNGLDVSGDTKVSGNVVFSGKTEMADISVSNILSTGNITTNSSLYVEGILESKIIKISERADFSSATFSNDISVGGDIISTKNSEISIGKINTGNIVISGRTGFEDKIESYVDIYAYKDLSVSNKISGNLITALSAFTLGSTENEDAVYLTTSGIHFSKDTAILGIKSITSENLIGRATIPYAELSQFNSSVSSGIISAISQSKFTVADNLSVDGILNVPRSLVVGGTLFFNKIVPLDTENGYIDIIAGAAVYE